MQWRGEIDLPSIRIDRKLQCNGIWNSTFLHTNVQFECNQNSIFWGAAWLLLAVSSWLCGIPWSRKHPLHPLWFRLASYDLKKSHWIFKKYVCCRAFTCIKYLIVTKTAKHFLSIPLIECTNSSSKSKSHWNSAQRILSRWRFSGWKSKSYKSGRFTEKKKKKRKEEYVHK